MTDHGPQAPNSEADMTQSYTARIGLLTDLHWSPEDSAELTTLIEDAFGYFDRTNVDRVIVLGDLVVEAELNPTDTETRIENAVHAIESTGFDEPVTYLLGNHDVHETDWTDFVSAADLDHDPRRGTFPLTDSITGIYLDSSGSEHRDARGSLGWKDREYLDHHLGESEYAVVFTHHPVYYHELAENGHFAEHPEAAFASDKYLVNEIVADHGNVIAGVNGHTHLSDHTVYQDVPYFTINAFNEERPGHEEPNGSFAVLEVSRDSVKRISHRHGTFDGTDTVTYPTGNQTVALGGTFGPIHDGHRNMFQRAFEIGDVLVGLTSNELAQQTRHTERAVPSFTDRFNTLTSELQELAELYDRSFEVKELNDPMEYVGDDPSITHLIVSPETFSRGEAVNETRLGNGIEPVTLEVVDPVLADDGQRISSTRIVNGEIDEHGTVLTD